MIVYVMNQKAELWDAYPFEAHDMTRLRMCSLVVCVMNECELFYNIFFEIINIIAIFKFIRLQSLDILMEKEIQVDLIKEYPFLGILMFPNELVFLNRTIHWIADFTLLLL